MCSESEDEETKRWEEEQINKGISASNQMEGPPPTREDHAYSYQSMDMISQSFAYASYSSLQYEGGVAVSVTGTNGSSIPVTQKPVIPEKLVPITLESLKSKLAHRLEDIKVSGIHFVLVSSIIIQLCWWFINRRLINGIPNN